MRKWREKGREETMEDKKRSGSGRDGEALPDGGVTDCTGTTALPEDNQARPRRHLQGLLDARLIGAEMANGEDPDDYILRLREGWD
jgi:hypothetical protein